MKLCPKCGLLKNIIDFNKDKTKKDGLSRQCRECHKEYNRSHKEEKRKYRQENKEKIAATNKRYNQNNKEKKLIYSKQYNLDNKEAKSLYGKKRYLNNKEAIRNRGKKYYLDNKEAILERGKKYYLDNKEEMLKHGKKYFQDHKNEISIYNKNKYDTDISYRLRVMMSGHINKSLRTINLSKDNNSWTKLVDFNIQELKFHLESKFQLGMSWDNHSILGWHIDHIRPISSFNITSVHDEDFKKCWCLENLQPLWAVDNLKKGSKYIR